MFNLEKRTRQFTTAPIATLTSTFCEIATSRSAQRLDSAMKEALGRMASHQVSMAITQAVTQLEKEDQRAAATWLQNCWQHYRV